ncbi:hypothetical protein CEXT_115761 [Caerostris extrusa]|uniref:Uncharacterized protein n=1 Tax=Caerostris extrusa TaxID=172846 RepID=A0AAV4NEY4_CAEEX|nr:hypothetical protein CEXT_115761 [Caerostris extrusa]
MKVFFFFLFEFLLFLTVRGTFAGFENCDLDKCQDVELSERLARANFCQMNNNCENCVRRLCSRLPAWSGRLNPAQEKL